MPHRHRKLPDPCPAGYEAQVGSVLGCTLFAIGLCLIPVFLAAFVKLVVRFL